MFRGYGRGGGYGGGGYGGGGYGGGGYGGGGYEEDEYEDEYEEDEYGDSGLYGGGRHGVGGFGGYGGGGGGYGGGYGGGRYGGGRHDYFDDLDAMGYRSDPDEEAFDDDSEDDYRRMSMSYPGEHQRGMRTGGLGGGLGGRQREFGLGAGLHGGRGPEGPHTGDPYDVHNGISPSTRLPVDPSEIPERGRAGRGRFGGRGGRMGGPRTGMASGVEDSDFGGSTLVPSDSEASIGGGYAGARGVGGRSRGHRGHRDRHGGGHGGGHRRPHGGGNGRTPMGDSDLSEL
ncbi:hypothetical protein MMC17_002765 [Xylographa soralifera]|nr:hypothetical protein [Xylographa soralifera]